MGCVMSKAKLQIFSINVSLMKMYIPINSVKIKKNSADELKSLLCYII